MNDRIVKMVKRECQIHKYPDSDKYGVGTEAACENCGWIARLDDTQRDGRHWVYSYPKRYINTKEE